MSEREILTLGEPGPAKEETWLKPEAINEAAQQMVLKLELALDDVGPETVTSTALAMMHAGASFILIHYGADSIRKLLDNLKEDTEVAIERLKVAARATHAAPAGTQ